MEKTWSEILADNRVAREAYNKGSRELQYFDAHRGVWCNTSDATGSMLHRIRPEPQLRQYTPEEWLGFYDGWFKHKESTSVYRAVGISIAAGKLRIDGEWVCPAKAFDWWEHYDPATGETRQCGVVE